MLEPTSTTLETWALPTIVKTFVPSFSIMRLEPTSMTLETNTLPVTVITFGAISSKTTLEPTCKAWINK